MSDEIFMQRCLDLAKKGLGRVSPNPMVGSVIVHNNVIIGEGWHQKAGLAHAEVNAIDSVKDLSLLSESTLYVNLEPCAHFGKTPPCSDLILQKEIPKVVIGCRDSFSEVDGKGIQRLRNAGVEILVGILEKESMELNKRFFTFHNKKRPYVILKWAQTQDGFIDKIRTNDSAGPNWISGTESKTLVHRWRSEEDGILVGPQTVINDDPSLTVREVDGRNPIRLVLDRNGRVSENAKVFDQSAPSVWFRNSESENADHITSVKTGDQAINEVLTYCFQNNIQSIIVEGGAQILGEFIKNTLWDEARVFIGETKFREGLKAPLINKAVSQTLSYGKDQLLIYKNI